jgi:RimJ/RimL family protein N-acetyltransferase|tara:strand:+ start:179 stop:640 length:462 start_codon:yes stop_codon:yes gene_type:complete
MAQFSARMFDVRDTKGIQGWYDSDRAGLERLVGRPLPTWIECMQAFNHLLGAALQGQALFWMVDRDDALVGCVVCSDLAPASPLGRAHIYVDPQFRRYSVDVARVGLDGAKEMGIQRVMVNIERSNRAACALAKKMGFAPLELDTVMMQKELV